MADDELDFLLGELGHADASASTAADDAVGSNAASIVDVPRAAEAVDAIVALDSMLDHSKRRASQDDENGLNFSHLRFFFFFFFIFFANFVTFCCSGFAAARARRQSPVASSRWQQ
jgi:hypothetical protein